MRCAWYPLEPSREVFAPSLEKDEYDPQVTSIGFIWSIFAALLGHQSTLTIGKGPGTYKDLTYNAWVVVGSSGIPFGGLGGLVKHSPPNFIVRDSTYQSTNGTPTFTVAAPYKSASFK